MSALAPVPQFPTRLARTMWGVTTYFNPAGYASKQHNLRLFCEAARNQKLPLLVVELSSREAASELDAGLADRVLRWRSETVLWHKERLLNLCMQQLPPECDKVVWLDADILFENTDWVAETASLLERYVVVQPFQHACWLTRGQLRPDPGSSLPGIGPGRTFPGMAFAMSRKPDKLKALGNYYQHGHSGFAWAARREILARHGLYDRLILGGGDLAIAQSFYTASPCIAEAYPLPLATHLKRWSDRFYADVQASVGYASGRVFHLWHGENDNRGYEARLQILHECAFDPEADIRPDAQGCWEWSSDKPDLHRRVRDYFSSRREDGC